MEAPAVVEGLIAPAGHGGAGSAAREPRADFGLRSERRCRQHRDRLQDVASRQLAVRPGGSKRDRFS